MDVRGPRVASEGPELRIRILTMPDIDLANQVRQTLLVGFVGTEASTVAPFIQRLRPGGLAVLPRNVVSAEQLSDLTAGLQQVARAEGLPPLLIAADQEGGAVARLSSDAGFTDLPGAMAVGLTGDPGAARDLAALAGRELAAVGIDFDLAPVVDLAIDKANTVIGSRSFGSDPALVSAMAAAWVEGLRSSGVLACAKHFPGHGATSIDSHLALPRLKASVAELEGRDFTPFRGAISAGCAAIMTGHVVSPLDPATPATLSRKTLTDVLRGRLGFDGLILTDALEMKALSETGLPPWRAGAEALRAGADVLVFEGDLQLIERSVAWIEGALEREELDPSVLAATSQRLGTARRALSAAAHDPRSVGSAEHLALSRRIATEGIRPDDAAGLLPLARPPVVLDAGAGRGFAEAVSWPLAAIEAIEANAGAVAVVADEDRLTDDIQAAIVRRSRAGLVTVVIVLAGWTVPTGLPPSVTTVLAYDLPHGLWPVIADRITGGAAVGSAADRVVRR